MPKADVVKQNKMLMQLPHVADMGYNGNMIFSSE